MATGYAGYHVTHRKCLESCAGAATASAQCQRWPAVVACGKKGSMRGVETPHGVVRTTLANQCCMHST